MAILEVGRLCVKIAGRDSGKECLVVDVIDSNFVLIDGNTRRRKCNTKHLQILPKVGKIKKNAEHDEVAKALADLGFKVEERKTKPKKEKTDKKEVIEEPKEEKKGLLSRLKKEEKPADKPKKAAKKDDKKKK